MQADGKHATSTADTQTAGNQRTQFIAPRSVPLARPTAFICDGRASRHGWTPEMLQTQVTKGRGASERERERERDKERERE